MLEIIVTRMRFICSQLQHPIRFVGLSTALANPRDLADWLGIGRVGVYNFRPAVRPIPMTIHLQGFPGKHYCPRMATMNKPAYHAILEHSPEKPTLVISLVACSNNGLLQPSFFFRFLFHHEGKQD